MLGQPELKMLPHLFLIMCAMMPRYYLALAVAGIIPLLCGARLYRWFGGTYMLAALLFAAGEHRVVLHQREEIQRIRAESQTQHQ